MYDQITANKRKTFVLIIGFMLVIGVLGYILGSIYHDIFGVMTIAGIIAIVMALASYYSGDKVALSMSGAIPIKKDDNIYVWRLVENLCIAQGMPMPKVYIIPDQAMNAFATGRAPEYASIALTQGIIDKLENEELEGVIAHELSHIKNYDIRLGTVIIILVGLVTITSDIMLRSRMFNSRSRDNESSGGAGIFMIIGIVLALLSPLIANLIKLAISRQREYLADASGALATRYPEGLARALEKIAQDGKPLDKASQATAHLYISSPFGSSAKFVSKMFSTHPPIADRVKALRQMA